MLFRSVQWQACTVLACNSGKIRQGAGYLFRWGVQQVEAADHVDDTLVIADAFGVLDGVANAGVGAAGNHDQPVRGLDRPGRCHPAGSRGRSRRRAPGRWGVWLQSHCSRGISPRKTRLSVSQTGSLVSFIGELAGQLVAASKTEPISPRPSASKDLLARAAGWAMQLWTFVCFRGAGEGGVFEVVFGIQAHEGHQPPGVVHVPVRDDDGIQVEQVNAQLVRRSSGKASE